MVRAILRGEKSVTRRIVKLPPDRGAWEATTIGGPGTTDRRGNAVAEMPAVWNTTTGQVIARPYTPGDTLYVKETWRAEELPDLTDGVRFRADDAFVRIESTMDAADAWVVARHTKRGDKHPERAWRPAIFMPRWASRLTLAVTGVRVERLQAITSADVLAEGVRVPVTAEGRPLVRLTGKHPPTDYLRAGGLRGAAPWTDDELLRAEFASLWDSINGERAAWDANPWVFVVPFERVPQ